jgi:sulfopyruvate decarboxylase TPP-binding subunit
VTHVVWLPDSYVGQWENVMRTDPHLKLIRATREGEAISLAAGLHIGGKVPVVVIQCTGLFEAGDALRNAVYDLKLPLFFIIGLRGYHAHQQGDRTDTCPLFAEPILRAWQIPYCLLNEQSTATDLAQAIAQARATKRAGAGLIAE